MHSSFLKTGLFFAAFISNSLLAAGGKITAKISLFPAGSFELVSEDLQGKLTKAGTKFTAAELKVPVASLKTGIGLRDEHTQEKLKIKEFPVITAKDIVCTGDKGTAQLTVAGVTKPVEFSLKDLGNKQAEVTFVLLLPDFKIGGISYKGVGVEDKTTVVAAVPYDGQ